MSLIIDPFIPQSYNLMYNLITTVKTDIYHVKSELLK